MKFLGAFAIIIAIPGLYYNRKQLILAIQNILYTN